MLTSAFFSALAATRRHDRRDHHTQLHLIEALSSLLANPLDFLGHRFRRAFARIINLDSGRIVAIEDADNVGFTRRDGKHALPAGADQYGWMWLLDGPGVAMELVNTVVIAGECERFAGKESLDDTHRLFKPAHPYTGRIEREARLLVLGLRPACAQTQFKPPIREHIERGGLLRQDDRMAVIIVEHQVANTKRPGGVRRRH